MPRGVAREAVQPRPGARRVEGVDGRRRDPTRERRTPRDRRSAARAQPRRTVRARVHVAACEPQHATSKVQRSQPAVCKQAAHVRSTPQAVHAPPYAFVMDCDSAPRRPARLPAAFFPESRDGTGESGSVRVRRARAQRERVYREGVGTHQSNARTLHGSSQKGLLASGMRSRRLANSCDHGSIDG